MTTPLIDIAAATDYLERTWPRDDWSSWSASRIQHHARRLSAAPAHLDDLLLAWACLDQVSEAVAELERTYLAPLAPAVRAIGLSPSDTEELLARARAKLLIGELTSEAALQQYRGGGPLGGFVRTTVLRLAIDVRRRQLPSTDEIERLVQNVAADPTVDLVKKQYGGVVSDVLRTAWKSLSADARLLLSYQVFDGLSVDEIGRLLKVHRSTAARRCVVARERLLVELRRRLAVQLGAGTGTVDSIVRAVMTSLTGGALSMGPILPSTPFVDDET
jgi:RNA polymerase sigma-70 factor, ECF subfamily